MKKLATFGVAALFALAVGCGKKNQKQAGTANKPGASRQTPGQKVDCKTMCAQMQKCGDEFVNSVVANAGVPEAKRAAIAQSLKAQFANPARCVQGCEKDKGKAETKKILTCYNTDCKAMGACVGNVVKASIAAAQQAAAQAAAAAAKAGAQAAKAGAQAAKAGAQAAKAGAQAAKGSAQAAKAAGGAAKAAGKAAKQAARAARAAARAAKKAGE